MHLPHAARLLAMSAIVMLPRARAADGAADRLRHELAPVRRVAVLPAFFGATTATDDGTENQKQGEEPKRKEYLADLQTLADHEKMQMPGRVEARTPFKVTAASEVCAALRDAKLTPEKMFQNEGRIRNMKFSPPDPIAVKEIANRLHVDALILTTLDAPHRTNGQYYVDVYGLNYDAAHARAKAAFFVVLADGTEVFHDYVEALHPVTRSSGSRSYIMADWTEAEDTVVEDFLDELSRYTPPAK